MKKLTNLLLATAVLAVPALGFTQNIENAANLSQSAVSAGSFEASRDLAAKALENIKLESSVPADTATTMPVSRVNLQASPLDVTIEIGQNGYNLSDGTASDAGYGGEDKAGFFKTLGKALVAPSSNPAELAYDTAIRGGSNTKGYVKTMTGSNGLAMAAAISAGILCAALGFAVGTLSAVIKTFGFAKW